MKLLPSLMAAVRRWNLSTVLSVLALAISAMSLYYSRQSELRQLEQLIVSDGDILSLDMTTSSYAITKSFLITNVSERLVSIQSIKLDIKRPFEGRDSSPVSIKIADREVYYKDELNLVIKPGEELKLVVSSTPSVGYRAATFLRQQKSGENGDKIAALCKQVGIDFYDNPLNEAQQQLCPSFRQYKGRHNFQFALPSSGNGDILTLVVRTYRDNAFASDNFKLEIGNSVL